MNRPLNWIGETYREIAIPREEDGIWCTVPMGAERVYAEATDGSILGLMVCQSPGEEPRRTLVIYHNVPNGNEDKATSIAREPNARLPKEEQVKVMSLLTKKLGSNATIGGTRCVLESVDLYQAVEGRTGDRFAVAQLTDLGSDGKHMVVYRLNRNGEIVFPGKRETMFGVLWQIDPKYTGMDLGRMVLRRNFKKERFGVTHNTHLYG